MKGQKGLFHIVVIALLAIIIAASPRCIIGNDVDVNAAEKRPTSSSQIAPYSGKASIRINNNKPYFKKIEFNQGTFEKYGQLDSKGRCTAATAMISKDLMPTEERGAIGHIRPTGWHTIKYPDLISDRYLYNRCHMIGFQLTGENGNERNLITGTRYMNVEGMVPYENKVANYIKATGDMVFYRVEPIFDGNNMLASGVLIEAKSKKAGGLSFCVYCYNVQPGISINYTNGASSIDEVYVAAHPEVLVQNSVSTASSNNNSSSGNSSSASLSLFVKVDVSKS